MTTQTHSFAEGDDVFITSTAPGTADQVILFASTIAAILPTENGDLIVADGLRFTAGADGVFASPVAGSNRPLFLHPQTGELVDQLKAAGRAARAARQERKAEAARRRGNIQTAEYHAFEARDAADKVAASLPDRKYELTWASNALVSATTRRNNAKNRVDAFETDVAAAKDKVAAAERALAQVIAENS